jgi:hypothetical protein
MVDSNAWEPSTMRNGAGSISTLAMMRAAFDAVFQAAGVRVVRSAIQAPRMNSIIGHQSWGVETPDFRPGRKRRSPLRRVTLI